MNTQSTLVKTFLCWSNYENRRFLYSGFL